MYPLLILMELKHGLMLFKVMAYLLVLEVEHSVRLEVNSLKLS